VGYTAPAHNAVNPTLATYTPPTYNDVGVALGMAYTPPVHAGVFFELASYTPPLYNEVDFVLCGGGAGLAISVLTGGTWKDAPEAWVLIGGTWKVVSEVYVLVSGAWKVV
jgi:hypothetical protein